MLAIQTQVLTLVQEALYRVSSLPNLCTELSVFYTKGRDISGPSNTQDGVVLQMSVPSESEPPYSPTEGSFFQSSKPASLSQPW